MADYTKYTNKEMQAITLAQQITDDNIAIVGTGLPLIGASVAKRLFAPKCNLIVESGLMDCSPIAVSYTHLADDNCVTCICTAVPFYWNYFLRGKKSPITAVTGDFLY